MLEWKFVRMVDRVGVGGEGVRVRDGGLLKWNGWRVGVGENVFSLWDVNYIFF